MRKKQHNRRYLVDAAVSVYMSLLSALLLFAPVSATGGTWAHLWTNDISLSTVDGSYLGELTTDLFGNAGSILGDINGDGYGDIAVGATSNDQSGSSAGKAYIIFGKASGWAMDTAATSTNIGASFLGDAAGDRAGTSVVSIGDVNGDGFRDLAVGGIQNDESASNAGQVYIIFGKASGWSLDRHLSAVANASFLGKDADDQFGRHISALGDVNGDGFNDFLVCSDVEDESDVHSGHCYLFWGKSSGWAMDQNVGTAGVVAQSFVGTGANNLFGIGSAGIGDVNGDGYMDFAVGADDNSDAGTGRGQVYIYFGKSSGWTGATSNAYTAADATFVGEQNNSFLGAGLTGLGDVNGDGLSDFAVTASGYSGSASGIGKVYVIFGKTSGWAKGVSISTADASYVGELTNDTIQQVAGYADVNHDGYNDFVISGEAADEAGTDAGEVYVVFGQASGWASNVSLGSANASFLGEAASDFAGRSVSTGDVNGDGAADILIAAYANDENGSNAGQVYVILAQTPPSVSLSTVTAAADGTGHVFVTSTVSDTNQFSQAMRVNYRSGTNCVSSTSAATLGSVVTASYADTGGAPTVTNASFQVGSETHKKIITSSGANTVGVVWNTQSDIPTANGTYCVAVTVTDAGMYSSVVSTTIAIDNTPPTAPGLLTISTTTPTSIGMMLAGASTETNFKEYKILYATSTPIATSTFSSTFTSSTDANLGSRTYSGATSSTLSSLVPNTAYYLNIVAYDTFGYTAIGSVEAATSTPAAVPASLSLSSDSQRRITASWSANQNPAGTEYYAENMTAGTNSGWTTATSWISDNLICDTKYFFRVRARATGGRETVNSGTVADYPMACQGGGAGSSGASSASPQTAAASAVVRHPFRIESPPEEDTVYSLPFDVKGTADPGAHITVSIAGSRYGVDADATGWYAVTVLDALSAGEYTIQVLEQKDGLAPRSLSRAIEYATAVDAASLQPIAPESPSSIPLVKPIAAGLSSVPVKKPAQRVARTPIDSLPPATVDTVKQEVAAAQERPAFLLVMKKETSQFHETQTGDITAVPGETLSIMIRPNIPVHSMTSRLYAEAPAGNGSPWVESYGFDQAAVTPGLYIGLIRIPKISGKVYTLRITLNGVDGTRTMIDKEIHILPQGVVYSGTPSSVDGRIARARITVYAQMPDGAYGEWNAEQFGQTNPFWSDAAGEYSIALPAGTYYVSAEASGFEPYHGAVFTLPSPSVFHEVISLSPKQYSVGWAGHWQRLFE